MSVITVPMKDHLLHMNKLLWSYQGFFICLDLSSDELTFPSVVKKWSDLRHLLSLVCFQLQAHSNSGALNCPVDSLELWGRWKERSSGSCVSQGGQGHTTLYVNFTMLANRDLFLKNNQLHLFYNSIFNQKPTMSSI